MLFASSLPTGSVLTIKTVLSIILVLFVVFSFPTSTVLIVKYLDDLRFLNRNLCMAT